METEPLERIEEHQSGETPEDVAILYSWANLQGAKYRDFSANRREYRAQMRHRAAEQLRLMELRAQSEAEAAATHAEAEAAAAHAEADAATVKLAVSRAMPSLGPDEMIKEKEVEEVRRASLREAAQQARRAAAERLEAARRSEAAALADSIARREEREIAEAQASALRQAERYHESEVRSKQMMAQHPDLLDHVPGQISDPYSPQILPEGEYYDGPGTPPSELEASRFRTQREYIERSTGAELSPFKMPPLFSEDRLETRRVQDPDHIEDESRQRNLPRGLNEISAEGREFLAEDQRRERHNSFEPQERRPGRQLGETLRDALSRDRKAAPAASRRDVPETPRTRKAEVVSKISDGYDDSRWLAAEAHEIPSKERKDPRYDGSLLNHAAEGGAEERSHSSADSRGEREWNPGPEDDWKARRNGVAIAAGGTRQSSEAHRDHTEAPQLYSATPRPSGSWLRQISARDAEDNPRRESTRLQEPVREIRPERLPERGLERMSPRPSVEATYNDGRRSESSSQYDQQPSGFRPPWLTQAQAPRQSGQHRVQETVPETAQPIPRWLYPEQAETQATTSPASMFPTPMFPTPTFPAPTFPAQTAPQKATPILRESPHASAAEPGSLLGKSLGVSLGKSLQATQADVASRWFALKSVFARANEAQPAATAPQQEKSSTPMVIVCSMAGGVGKTSLVATLGRTLSSLGEKVLLADTTSSGLLPFYFGANQLSPGVVRTFSPPEGSTDAPVHMVSYDSGHGGLDGAAQAGLVDDLITGGQQVNRVLVDLDSSFGWLVERIARLRPALLVPVAADMNSIVSLQAMEKKFGAMRSADGEPLRPFYLLNQFDASLPLHVDLREVLRQQLGERLLPFVIRRASAISEALAEGMTIVDYDPDSTAAQDFLGLANWVRAVYALVPAGAAAGLRNLRWSER